MGIKIIMSGDTEVEIIILKFHQRKSPISADDVDDKKIVVSNKFPFG